MVWWQGLLVIIGCVAAGALLGMLLGYLVLRIQKRPWPFSKNHRAQILDVEQMTSSVQVHDPLREYVRERQARNPEEKPKPKTQAQDTLAELVKKRSAVVEKPIEVRKPDTLVEIETNLSTATIPWAGKLQPFQTNVWDTRSGEFFSFGPDLLQELTEAYADMRLANSIVWLSTEVGRTSKELDESYIKLCTKIAERLRSVIQNHKQVSP